MSDETSDRILIVEDERAIADAVALNLRDEGYDVTIARRGDEGLRRALDGNFDLLILDLMLPGLDGRDVCRRVRQRSKIPILMLTARSREIDKVLGLEIGADDYLGKPFGMLELLARVKALLRRARAGGRSEEVEEETYRVGSLKLDVTRHGVSLGGADVALRPKEFDLLRVLVINHGRVVPRDRLLELVWGEDRFLDRGTLDVHIRWLRQKLEADPSNPRRIKTVRGVGYTYAGDED